MCSWKFVNICLRAVLPPFRNISKKIHFLCLKDFKGHFYENKVSGYSIKKLLNPSKSYCNRTNNIFF